LIQSVVDLLLHPGEVGMGGIDSASSPSKDCSKLLERFNGRNIASPGRDQGFEANPGIR